MTSRLIALIAVAACSGAPHPSITPTTPTTSTPAASAGVDGTLTDVDRDAVTKVTDVLAKLSLVPVDPAAVQLEIAFDGTWDDRDRMANDTNPALIDGLFDGSKHYETGVGTTKWTAFLGGIAGFGIKKRIEHAYHWLVDEIAKIEKATPGVPIAVIVTGFSRGATTARAFVNVLRKRGLTRATIAAMILFDTVGSVGIPGTNLNPGLDLSIPSNVANVLHLTARDEKRMMFPLSSALDPLRPDDVRITELSLPGVHSDIGGSYANPYSRIPLHLAYEYLHRIGVHLRPFGDVIDLRDSSLRLHDSHGSSSIRTVFPSHNPLD